MTPEELRHYATLDQQERAEVDDAHEAMMDTTGDAPLRFRVLRSAIPSRCKKDILRRLESTTLGHPGMESAKYMTWIETLLKVPFDVVKPLPVSSRFASRENIRAYLKQCRGVLDRAVWGHQDLKDTLECVIAGWIRTDGQLAAVNALGIGGPMGIGKTTAIKAGLAAAVDRPFVFLSCGGNSAGGAMLRGHSFTYEGSLPGAIAEAFISTGCINPIIMLDEVDKISEDPRGVEILNTLVHLLDPAQNSEFHDSYLGLELDVSKVFFVLTYNDVSKIPAVLLDRMLTKEMHDFEASDKEVIARQYILPEVLRGLGLSEDWVRVEDEALREVVRHTSSTNVVGLRSVRHALLDIVAMLGALDLCRGDNEEPPPNPDLEDKDISRIPRSVLEELRQDPTVRSVLDTASIEGTSMSLSGEAAKVLLAAWSKRRDKAPKIGVDTYFMYC